MRLRHHLAFTARSSANAVVTIATAMRLRCDCDATATAITVQPLATSCTEIHRESKNKPLQYCS